MGRLGLRQRRRACPGLPRSGLADLRGSAGAHQLQPPGRSGHDHHAERWRAGSAAHRRRHELPPQVVPILDMAVAEEARAMSCPNDDRQDGEQPGGGEALRQQAAVAIECRGATAAGSPGRSPDRAPLPSPAPSAAKRRCRRRARQPWPTGRIQAAAQAQSDSPAAPARRGCRRNATARSAPAAPGAQPVQPIGHGRRGAGDRAARRRR